MNAETVNEVFEFVAKEARVKVDKLTLKTDLLDDLGIDGDDAIDFLKAFAEEFGVDMRGLDLKKHFGPEGYIPSVMIGDLLSILSGNKDEDPKLVPIYLSDLIEAAETKRWKMQPSSPPR